jgi:EmrB/QacA subfamily drug resistance transporter
MRAPAGRLSRVTRKQRVTLLATILGSTVVFLDATVVNVALPAIRDDLGAGLAGQQWVVEAYLLTLVALLLVGGSLGDQFGRRRMFVAGLIGFGATSVLCAIAPSDELLVVARGLQGIAGALLVPGSLAIVSATFEGAERGRAVGIWTAWTGIATVVGPAGGGWLVEALSWRWIFWVNVPLVIATIVLTLRVVEESKDPEAVPGIDWLGIVLSAVGLGGPVYALIEQPNQGWGDPQVFAPLIIGVVCLGLFLWHEARTAHPMLDLSLFRIRNFAVANIATLFAYAGLYGGFFFVTIYLQQTADYSPLEAGLATTPVSVLMFVLSPRFGKLASGTGPRVPMTVGPILAGVGMLLYLRVDASADYVGEVLPATLVFGLGLAAMVAPLTATVLDSVEERRAGVASGINNGISRVAGLLAIAVIGAAVASSYGAELGSELAQANLSPQGANAVERVRDEPLASPRTTGLGGSEAGSVEGTVDEASTSAFHLSAVIAGALMIVGGVVAGIGIRNPRRPPEYEPTQPGAAAIAGECGRCPDDPSGRGAREPGKPEPEPAPA